MTIRVQIEKLKSWEANWLCWALWSTGGDNSAQCVDPPPRGTRPFLLLLPQTLTSSPLTLLPPPFCSCPELSLPPVSISSYLLWILLPFHWSFSFSFKTPDPEISILRITEWCSSSFPLPSAILKEQLCPLASTSTPSLSNFISLLNQALWWYQQPELHIQQLLPSFILTFSLWMWFTTLLLKSSLSLNSITLIYPVSLMTTSFFIGKTLNMREN